MRKKYKRTQNGGTFLIKLEVKVNDWYYERLKKLSIMKGIPMAHIIRWYIYEGLKKDLQSITKEKK